MRPGFFLFVLLIFCNNLLPAQPPINEEKVKKAVVLMKKMMDDPAAMQTVYMELEQLKLSSAENKEAQQRMKQQAMGQADAAKKEVEAKTKQLPASVPQPGNSRVPVRNAQKIAAIPPTPTAPGLPAHLQKLSKALEAALPPVIKQEALDVYEQLARESKNAKEMGEGVVGLWLMGHAEHAVIVAGRVCMKDPSLAENINNYAALLNMLDAQQMAVPLLQFLNKQYPGNPTILGNLGQSWYGLGEMNKAAQFLDSAMKIAPWHSQAHQTKSMIEEQRGNKAAAAEELMASMEAGYTEEKAARLRKLGYGKDNVHWPLHIPQDPLGFNKFSLPPFPYSIEDCKKLSPAWEYHWKQMSDLQHEFAEDMARLQAKADEYEVNALKGKIHAYKRGGLVPDGVGPLSARATAKLSYLLNDKDGGLTYKIKKAEDRLIALGQQLHDLDSIRSSSLEKVMKQLDCPDGEGSSAAGAVPCCKAIDEITNTWLLASNKLTKEVYEEAIDLYKKLWSAQAYFSQYTMSAPSFEAAKAQFKYLYAGVLATVRPAFAGPSVYCDSKPLREYFKQPPLQNFDDVACKYHSRLEFKFLTIESNCSRMKTSIDLKKFKFSFTEDLTKVDGILPGNIIAGTADVSISIGNKGLGKWGPVKAEASAGVDVHIEVTDQGISEVSATVGADVSVSTDMLDKATSIENAVKNGGKEFMEETGTTVIAPVPGAGNKSAKIGAAATISLNSGSSVSGTGMLSGLKW